MIKRIIPIVILSIILTSTALASYSDVDESHFNYDAIQYLSENGVVQGYEDGTFKPDQKVNRAEFLKILIEGNNIELDSVMYNNCFPDVTDQWFSKYVCYSKEMNWIQGYEDGTFKPENQIAFVESVKMLIEIHDYAQELAPSNNPEDQWYVPYAELAIDKGFVNLTEAPYDPLRYMNRADIAEMTYRSMIYKKPVEEEEVIEAPVISMGESDAPVTIVEYSDYQCPFCKKLYDEVFEQLKTDYIERGDVLYIVKDFPLSYHQQAAKASHAARCANDQEKFWEMRDLIYANQSEWSSADDFSTYFTEYAQALELDMTLFDSCMEGEIHASEINMDLVEGQLAGVMGTPTLIVNGEFFIGSQPYEELIDLIDRLLYANF